MLKFFIFISVWILSKALKRRFIPISKPKSNFIDDISLVHTIPFRVLQFNVLADGLSGLRPDLGQFNRVSKDVLNWDSRKYRLLEEIKQYAPDIITMQEVDHFHDFFQPEFNKLGYSGYFAPKPTSACLEVSTNSDGCALFINRKKLKVISCETKTLALSIAGLNEGELEEDDSNIKAQNQVGIIAVCELLSPPDNCTTTSSSSSGSSSHGNSGGSTISSTSVTSGNLDNALIYKSNNVTNEHISTTDNSTSNSNTHTSSDIHLDDTSHTETPPPMIICTTHLKSAKTAVGERFRQKGILQLLDMIETLSDSFMDGGRPPAILLTGDFNAVSEETYYGPPLTYQAIKNHQLYLNSVYNDDSQYTSTPLNNQLYTTWKSRTSTKNGEKITKRCIDYIFYGPYIPRNYSINMEKSFLRNKYIQQQENEREEERRVDNTFFMNKWIQSYFDRINRTDFKDNMNKSVDEDEIEAYIKSTERDVGTINDDNNNNNNDNTYMHMNSTTIMNDNDFEVDSDVENSDSDSDYEEEEEGDNDINYEEDDDDDNEKSNNNDDDDEDDDEDNDTNMMNEILKNEILNDYITRQNIKNEYKSIKLSPNQQQVIDEIEYSLDVNNIPRAVAKTSKQVALSLFYRILLYTYSCGMPFISLFKGDINLEQTVYITILAFMFLVLFEAILETESSPFNPLIPSKINSQIEQISTIPSLNERTFLVKITALGKRILNKRNIFQTGRPGLEPIAILDVLSDIEVGPNFLPSLRYPSDHLAIAVDFELTWEPKVEKKEEISGDLENNGGNVVINKDKVESIQDLMELYN